MQVILITVLTIIRGNKLYCKLFFSLNENFAKFSGHFRGYLREHDRDAGVCDQCPHDLQLHAARDVTARERDRLLQGD